MEEKFLNAFAYAAQTQDMKMLGFLMGECGSLRKKDKNRLLAAVAQKAPHGKLLKPLIDAGADASYTDGDGNGLLHLVAATGHRKVASFLVGLGLDVNARNKAGDTPLCVAARKARNPGVLRCLIDAGADMSVRAENNENLLMLAAKVHTTTDTIRMLCYHRAICNNRDDRGRTVLHYAAANSDPTIYDFLTNLAELEPDGEFGGLADVEDCKGHKPEYYRKHRDEF